MYTLKLVLTKEQSTLSLLNDGQIRGERHWLEARDMGRQLFEGIDDLLRERGLQPRDISEFFLETGTAKAVTGHASDAFWTTKHVAPGVRNPENEPFLSDLTGSTSIKIAETVARVYTWAVSEEKLRETSDTE
jgi:hypothetical protein